MNKVLSMNTVKLFGVSVGSAFLVACGDSVTEVSAPVDTLVVGRVDSLPECAFENRGRTAFVSENAAVYVCSDSKWNNLVLSSDSASCALETLSDSSGYRIMCDGDSVGVVLDGVDGRDGAAGEQGNAGADGKACSLSDDGAGTVLQICGEDTLAFQKALCDSVPYEPSKSFCYAGTVYPQNAAYEILVDERDGNRYRTVQIGSQTWMAENLRFETDDSNCLGDELRCLSYGRYYRVRDLGDPYIPCDSSSGEVTSWSCSIKLPGKNICPKGFHVPNMEEWKWLVNYVDRVADGDVGKVLKSRMGWDEGDGKAMNGMGLFGFDAKPSGGYYGKVGEEGMMEYGSDDFLNVDDAAAFWIGEAFFLPEDSYWSERLGVFILEKYGKHVFATLSSYSNRWDDLRVAVRCLKD